MIIQTPTTHTLCLPTAPTASNEVISTIHLLHPPMTSHKVVSPLCPPPHILCSPTAYQGIMSVSGPSLNPLHATPRLSMLQQMKMGQSSHLKLSPVTFLLDDCVDIDHP